MVRYGGQAFISVRGCPLGPLCSLQFAVCTRTCNLSVTKTKRWLMSHATSIGESLLLYVQICFGPFPSPSRAFQLFQCQSTCWVSLMYHNIQSICQGSLSNSQGDSVKFVYILNMVKSTSNNSLRQKIDEMRQ